MPDRVRHQRADHDQDGSWSDEGPAKDPRVDVCFPGWRQCGKSGSRKRAGSHIVDTYSDMPIQHKDWFERMMMQTYIT